MADETQTDETTSEAPAPAAPDFSEQFTAIQDKLDRLAPPPPTEADPTDLLGDYNYDDEDTDTEPAYEPQYQQEQYQPPEDPRVAQLYEWATQREQMEATQKLQALGEKYPDLKEPKMLDQVRAELDQITADPVVRNNPRLVEKVYLAIKAEADANAETPAEEARGRGAKLETDASAGAASEPSPDDAFIEAFGKGRESSVFG